MVFIQASLDLVVKNQVGLSTGLPKTITNKGSSCFQMLKLALNLII